MSQYKKPKASQKKKIKEGGISKVLSSLSGLGKKSWSGIKKLLSLDHKEKAISNTPELKTSGRAKPKVNRKKKSYTNDFLQGKINVTSSGNAFVTVEGLKQDVFISKDKPFRALEGDEVSIRIKHKKEGRRPEGEIMKVIKRETTEFVGMFQRNPQNEYGFIIVDSHAIHVDIYVPESACNGAKNKDKVIVKLLNWPNNSPNPTGEIIKVLGPCGEHEVEMHAILAQYNLPYEFSKEVESEAQNISKIISANDVSNRKDLRGITTFTIDPLDAKDFDDALSLRAINADTWEVGVHIADVSHYIREGSLVDEEAYRRATSVYLVDRVVPMLPEVLSNELCSLRPDEDKLCFSALFEMNKSGEVSRSWFGKTIIRSNRRFTYEEAQGIIEKKQGELCEEILTLNSIARSLRSQRSLSGSINFETVEIKFHLDKKFHPIGVYKKESKEAHQMVEEFMLLANRKVSEFVSLNSKGEPLQRTYIYRVHDEPDLEKLNLLQQFIKPLGYELNLKNKQAISQSINALLKNVGNKPEQNVIESLAMRSMSKAKYSTKNIGHYGLAFNYYTHFTSPIRRYSDVIAHRLLEYYLKGGGKSSPIPYEEKTQHCSQRERLAMEAERESVKYMQVRYMEGFVGERSSGIISGITDWGLFVELLPSGAEGMIRLRDLRDDVYSFYKESYSLIGKNQGHVYKLGAKVQVIIKEANLEKRQLNLELIRN